MVLQFIHRYISFISIEGMPLLSLTLLSFLYYCCLHCCAIVYIALHEWWQCKWLQYRSDATVVVNTSAAHTVARRLSLFQASIMPSFTPFSTLPENYAVQSNIANKHFSMWIFARNSYKVQTILSTLIYLLIRKSLLFILNLNIFWKPSKLSS